ncbi:SRPBCC family protein [Parafrankia discariae]|uniref:SRPBCC family protein n=1 Tax=Parafrankia discariae TaxID=365528 RepID=UPI0007C73F67|nr:SRPBCC family protein [Parafrankia discariae]
MRRTRNTWKAGTREARAEATRQDRVAKALGLFSLGLGAAEIGAPTAVVRVTGTENTAASRAVSRALGTREIASGVCVLGSRRPGRWLWGRVAGDAIDLSVLVIAVLRHRDDLPRLLRQATAAGAIVGVTIADVIAARRHAGGPSIGPMRARSSTTVRRTPDDLYRTWHDLEVLPTFMYHLDSVRTSNGHSHWKTRGPAGTTVEWDAEIVEDRPGELIGWRSVGDADVRNAGTVRFVPAPGGRGTEVHVELEYDVPAGAPGAAVAKLLGEEPGQQIADDLRRFKQLMETGEVVRSEGSPTGARSAVHLLGQHPARPLG